MRPTAKLGGFLVVCALAIAGCGGTSAASVEKEIDALKAEAPSIKDEPSAKAFNQKVEAIATKIKSLPAEQQPALQQKLGLVIVEAAFKGGFPGMPGMPGGGIKIDFPGGKIDIGPK